MKKSLLITLTLASLVLTACQNGQTKPSETSSSSTKVSSSSKAKSSSSSTVSSSSTAPVDTQSLFKPLLDQYQLNGHYGQYAYYDIDKNGTDELLLANNLDGELALGLVAYAKGASSAILPEGNPAEGRRLALSLYANGQIILEDVDVYNGGGKAVLYQLKSDNSGLEEVKTGDLSAGSAEEVLGLAGQGKLSLAGLNWQNFAPATAQGSMDLNPLSRGDYSSIAGTWRNANGDQFVFDANGLTDGNQIEAESVQIDNDVMTVQVRSGVSGFAMSFIPAGTVNRVPGVTDGSDQSKDRIWAGQNSGTVSDPAAYYYKID